MIKARYYKPETVYRGEEFPKKCAEKDKNLHCQSLDFFTVANGAIVKIIMVYLIDIITLTSSAFFFRSFLVSWWGMA
ncbi:MAG: hypothetical protein HQL77_16265 [Magnetococcales bacterium]|nr:hypothetical protein [Magnetococcales bacterium]